MPPHMGQIKKGSQGELITSKMAESNVNLMVVLKTSFDLYEMIFGWHGGLARRGGWRPCVPSWLRNVSRWMRALIDGYTEYIYQRLERQEIVRQRLWRDWLEYDKSTDHTRRSWGEDDPSAPPRPSTWAVNSRPNTVFKCSYGWARSWNGEQFC